MRLLPVILFFGSILFTLSGRYNTRSEVEQRLALQVDIATLINRYNSSRPEPDCTRVKCSPNSTEAHEFVSLSLL